ncbi:MAG: UMP kinase [Bacteroidales bacterium]|nr:UMP kinase [Bacteroidales bacterium]MBR4497868.1 UMP kinase [Bacteroidales bacterium]
MLRYKKILLKFSGESLQAADGFSIDPEKLMKYAHQVKEVFDLGVKVSVVIGGGNIYRGLNNKNQGFDRIKGDYMGMMATVINAVALQSALETISIKSQVLTGFSMEPVGQAYSPRRVQNAFNNNEVVIFGGGTGNPFFTTDTAAALRAVEIGADVLLKGTRVDGVYDSDPEKNPNAVKYDEITFTEAYSKGLKIMDLTAFTMCKENNLPIIVFNVGDETSLKKIVSGDKIGTIIKN